MWLLESRKIQILQAIVNDYVLTSKPVGSDRLIEVYNLKCKSATVRNEMAEMAEMGYLVQPHTSAGRIPTDRGYRFYVNELMDPPTALAPDEAQQAQSDVTGTQANDVEEIIVQTCRVLSGLTSYPSLATDPMTDATTLRRVYLTGASPRHVLLVALLSTGHVEHHLLDCEAAPNDATLLRLANYVNKRIADRPIEEIARTLREQEVPGELAGHSALLQKIVSALQTLTQTVSERRVFLEGTNQFLRQPEFKDVQRLEALLTALEQRHALYEVLSRALLTREVGIVIGSENHFAPMQECSVISTQYRIGTRPAGFLAVVGPTRMNYDRTVAAVTLMAENLSQMLTNLSLS